jgi:dTDP-glucose 4,6-dehydratase
MKSLLITGGCGFIGSNFIRYALLRHPELNILNLDKLTYAGNPENLTAVQNNSRYRFVKGDICNSELVDKLIEEHDVRIIVNFAAESHVDRSILSPEVFVETNVHGTLVLLEAARKYDIERFIQISTDEVYGELGETGYFTEETPVRPSSPYAASKAGADHLVQSYYRTYNTPVIITRSSNNFGPYQFPEKLIPLMILNAINDKPLPVYGDGLYVRDWIYVEDHCSAIDSVLSKGAVGEIYNIGAGNETTNISIVETILDILGKPRTLITYVKDRPGHDRRYATDYTKLKNETGWQPTVSFDAALHLTVEWYQNNKDWWNKILNGEYRTYYSHMYDHRDMWGRH